MKNDSSAGNTAGVRSLATAPSSSASHAAFDSASGVGRTDVASQAARAMLGLREMLLRGEFARGERISELPLVARLGVSRTPIRLALERLAHMGLLEVGAAGGFVVRGFAISDVYDAIELRGILEGAAARLAAERLLDSTELEPLRSYCAAMDRLERLTLESFQSYMDLNESFHNAVLELARSPILRRTLEQANSLPFAAPSSMVFPTSLLPRSDQTLAIAQEHHRAIVDAIARRHGSRAERLAHEHALIGRRVFEEAMSDHTALSRVPGGALINVSTR